MYSLTDVHMCIKICPGSQKAPSCSLLVTNRFSPKAITTLTSVTRDWFCLFYPSFEQGHRARFLAFGLSVMPVRFIQVVAHISAADSFLLLSNVLWWGNTPPHLSILSLADGHLCCFFSVRSIMNKAAMRIYVKSLCGHVLSLLL